MKKWKIPAKWKWHTLYDVSTINPGSNQPIPDYVSFIPMSAVQELSGIVDVSDIRKMNDVSQGYSSFIDGDILFAKITPCMENGKIALVNNLKNGVGFGSTEFHIVRPTNQVIPKYLFYYLLQNKIRKFAESRMTGSAGQRRVPSTFLKELIIPIPPLETQQKIVAILDKVEEIKRLRAEANAQTHRMIQSVFLDMFGDPNTNSLNLPTKKLIDVTTNFDRTRVPIKESDRDKIRGNFPYCGANGILDYINDYIYDGEFILLAEDGGYWGAGEQSAYIMTGKFWVNNHAHILQLNDRKFNSHFLVTVLNLMNLNRFISGTTRGKMTQSSMNNIIIPWPSVDQQIRFDQIITNINNINNLNNNCVKIDDNLQSTLLTKAFKGELVA